MELFILIGVGLAIACSIGGWCAAWDKGERTLQEVKEFRDKQADRQEAFAMAVFGHFESMLNFNSNAFKEVDSSFSAVRGDIDKKIAIASAAIQKDQLIQRQVFEGAVNTKVAALEADLRKEMARLRQVIRDTNESRDRNQEARHGAFKQDVLGQQEHLAADLHETMQKVGMLIADFRGPRHEEYQPETPAGTGIVVGLPGLQSEGVA